MAVQISPSSAAAVSTALTGTLNVNIAFMLIFYALSVEYSKTAMTQSQQLAEAQIKTGWQQAGKILLTQVLAPAASAVVGDLAGAIGGRVASKEARAEAEKCAKISESNGKLGTEIRSQIKAKGGQDLVVGLGEQEGDMGLRNAENPVEARAAQANRDLVQSLFTADYEKVFDEGEIAQFKKTLQGGDANDWEKLLTIVDKKHEQFDTLKASADNRASAQQQSAMNLFHAFGGLIQAVLNTGGAYFEVKSAVLQALQSLQQQMLQLANDQGSSARNIGDSALHQNDQMLNNILAAIISACTRG